MQRVDLLCTVAGLGTSEGGRSDALPTEVRSDRGCRTEGAGVRAGIEIAGWWVAGMLIWTATLASASAAELITGAVSALAAAVLARAARLAMDKERDRERDRRSRQPANDHRRADLPLARALPQWAVLVPVAAVLDSVRLSGKRARRLREPTTPSELRSDSQLVSRSLPTGHGAAATAWRQAAVIVISATLGSLVVDVDGDDGSMQLDPLVSGWPDLDQRVSR
jgi:hypothetical protein